VRSSCTRVHISPLPRSVLGHLIVHIPVYVNNTLGIAWIAFQTAFATTGTSFTTLDTAPTTFYTAFARLDTASTMFGDGLRNDHVVYKSVFTNSDRSDLVGCAVHASSPTASDSISPTTTDSCSLTITTSPIAIRLLHTTSSSSCSTPESASAPAHVGDPSTYVQIMICRRSRFRGSRHGGYDCQQAILPILVQAMMCRVDPPPYLELFGDVLGAHLPQDQS